MTSLAPLTTETEADNLINAGPAWILKHSNACPVSFAALEEVTACLTNSPIPTAVLTIQEQRPLSNWLATRLGYVHQSPQLFLVAGGKVRWQASHWGITQAAMAKALADVPHG